jgi:chemotaxis signal transduction protein
MREHVCARCGDCLLLFPAENIVFIEPVPSHTRFCEWTHRSRESGASPLLDLRRLVGIRGAAPAGERAALQWRSTDGGRQLTLLVDAVEEIVNCYEGDLIEVPILPRRLRPLCDQVMRDPRGGLRLRVKLDVQLPLERPGDRRRYALSLLTRADTMHAAGKGEVR